MSEENRSPSEEVRRMLDERGIEWRSETNCDTYWYGQDRTFYKFTEYSDGTTSFSTCQWNLTPKQALTEPIAATVGKPKVKKVCGMTYDEHGGEVYYLACSGCGEWIDGDLDCITEDDGPNFCPNCGGEFDGPLLCKRCGGLADLEYGDMCAECYEEVSE